MRKFIEYTRIVGKRLTTIQRHNHCLFDSSKDKFEDKFAVTRMTNLLLEDDVYTWQDDFLIQMTFVHDKLLIL